MAGRRDRSHPGAGRLDRTLVRWEWNLPAARYLRLLATTSQYAVLTAPVSSHLFNALREVLGDHVPLLGETQLNLMRKAC